MSDTPSPVRVFARSIDADRQARLFADISTLACLGLAVCFPLLVGIGPGLAFCVIAQTVMIVTVLKIFRPWMRRTLEASAREMHPNLLLDDEGLRFDSNDDGGIEWQDVSKLWIQCNPAGAVRSIRIDPFVGGRIVLWNYGRMEELEQALRSAVGPYVPTEVKQWSVDWERPTAVVGMSIGAVVVVTVAFGVPVLIGGWWLAALAAHMLFIAMGLLIAFAAPRTTRSESARRKDVFGGLAIALTGVAGALSHFL